MPLPPALKPSNLPMIAGGVAIAAIVAAAVVFWPREKPDNPDRDIPAIILSQEKAIEMQDKLAAANAFLRNGNSDMAAQNFETVLKDYDCTNEEAQRGLRTADPGNEERYRAAVAACER
jgi:hypothetical protein